jgi:predicted O-methyltransferase YrrM
LTYALLNLPRLSDSALTYTNPLARILRHPVYGWLGLRPALAQHTAEEHTALCRWAAGRSTVVEIGVAEGVSALAMREVMAERGTLYLIDPFHLSRLPALNFTKRAAHRVVAGSPRANVVWLEQFSSDAAANWRLPVDLLMIDGDHSEEAVRRDWNDWSHFVQPGGVVIFHDARLFEGGWTTPSYGPVRVVDDLFRHNRIAGWSIAEEIHSLVVIERKK